MERKNGAFSDRAHQVVLVGAGPAGIAAAAWFKAAGIDYVHIEEGRVGQTIWNYPRKVKLFSTRDRLEIAGIPFGEKPKEPPTREEYLEYLRTVVRSLRLKVRTFTEAQSVRSSRGVLCVRVRSARGEARDLAARNVVVAAGGYYAPVRLGIPGEQGERVSHYFRTELPARGRHILVVGGRNSAVEAAAVLAQKGALVTLAYRGLRLPRKKIKPWLLPPFEETVKTAHIDILYGTVPCRIDDTIVTLRNRRGGLTKIEVDRVLLLTGYGPDYELLRHAGVPFHETTGRPLHNPRTLETRTPGIFLCGTVVLTWQGEKASIENTRDHGRIILENLR